MEQRRSIWLQPNRLNPEDELPDASFLEEQQDSFKRRYGGLRRVTHQEKKWCQERSLDMNILREAAKMVNEVKHRFLRMKIPLKCLNQRARFGPEYPFTDLVLKTCIGGAFYNKYVKAYYKNEDMLLRVKANKYFDEQEAKQSLILNKVSDHISEGHLKQFFEGKFKVPVTKVSI